MTNTYNLIKLLENESSTNTKVELIKQYADETTKNVFQLTYDYTIQYYIVDLDRITKVPAQRYETYKDSNSELENIIELLELLSSRELTGNKALSAVRFLVEKLSDEANDILERILLRDLQCGVGVKLINKAIPNLIPTFEVMLAQQLDIDSLDPENFYYIEEKMDGVRFEAFADKEGCTLYTRNGNIANIPKIEKHLSSLAEIDEHRLVFSLEIVGRDRQSVSGIINKFLKGTAQPDDQKDLVAYVFDVQYAEHFEKQETGSALVARRLKLHNLFRDFESDCIKMVEYREYIPHHGNLKDLQTVILNYFNEIRAKGGEGVMVKDTSGTYEFKRSKYWLKMKDWNDADLKVVDYTKGYGARTGKIGSLICETSDGKLRVAVGSGFTEKDLDEITENIDDIVKQGTIVKIKYNSVIKDKESELYSLFLPIFVEFRFDKDTADSFDSLK